MHHALLFTPNGHPCAALHENENVILFSQ